MKNFQIVHDNDRKSLVESGGGSYLNRKKTVYFMRFQRNRTLFLEKGDWVKEVSSELLGNSVEKTSKDLTFWG